MICPQSILPSHAKSPCKVPELQSIKIPMKSPDPGGGEISCDMPIVAPHELLQWLLKERYVVLDDSAAERFWRHHEEVATPWLGKVPTKKDGYMVHPVALYGDEAEYTQTKQKILMVFLSPIEAPSLV